MGCLFWAAIAFFCVLFWCDEDVSPELLVVHDRCKPDECEADGDLDWIPRPSLKPARSAAD